MAGVMQTITVNASPEVVFTYLSDVTKHSEWANPGHKLAVKKTSKGPIGEGSIFETVGQQFGENKDTVTITEYKPNERVVYEAVGNAGTIRHTFEIKPSGEGVELSKTFEAIDTTMPFALFAPLLSIFFLPRTLRGDLERIKAKLEGAG